MQLLLDVSDFAEQDLKTILRELHDNDMAESIESLETEAERGAKGNWLKALSIQLQPENLPHFIKSVSDIYWQFVVPPKIKMEVDGVKIEVNRKEDLPAAIEHAKSLAKK